MQESNKNATPVRMKTVSLNCKEAAQLIRKALKAAYPATKFSVRCDRYSMGSSIYIGYKNGPVTEDVSTLAKQTVGCAKFDGLTDSTGYLTSQMSMSENGPVVYSCGSYISARREVDEEVAADFITRCIVEKRLEELAATDLYNRTAVELARAEMAKVAF